MKPNQKRLYEMKAEIIQAFAARFGAALDQGRLRPVIFQRFALEEVAEAHRLVKSSEHFGKVVLRTCRLRSFAQGRNFPAFV